MTGEAPPDTGYAYPHLRHRHPRCRWLIAVGQHHVSHLGVEDGGIADDDNSWIAQDLRTPHGVPAGVPVDVLGSVQGLAHMSGPPELLVKEIEERVGVAVCKCCRSR